MPPTLQIALRYHEAGDYARAAQTYREILASDPHQADAYHLLGVLTHQIGQSQTAVELIIQAIRIKGDFAPYHNNLGNAFAALGNREQARVSFRRSLQLCRNSDTYINMASLDLEDGRTGEAKAYFEAALRLQPNRIEGLIGLAQVALKEGHLVLARRRFEKALMVQDSCNAALIGLGQLHLADGSVDKAEELFNRAVACNPSSIDAHLLLGSLYVRMNRHASAAISYNQAFALSPKDHGIAVLLGMAYFASQNSEAAKNVFMRAVLLDDRHSESHHLLGQALLQCGDIQNALASFERALSLGCDAAKSFNAIGTLYDEMGDYARASRELKRALALSPESAIYLRNLGLVRARQNNREALSLLDKALALEPSDASNHVAKGEALLSFGEYVEGFAEYEWRWQCPHFRAQHRHYDIPLWDGKPLEGKSILIHAEQGLGDTIQFMRFVPEVIRRGGKVVLVVPELLLRLFESIEGVVSCVRSTDPLPMVDVRCPLLSLPTLLQTELQTIPEPINLDRMIYKSQGRQRRKENKVGLVWAGNSKHKRDRLRSLSLAALLPLREVEGCRFINLQITVPSSDEKAAELFGMENALNNCKDMLDTARVVNDLDLVVSVDTCVAHLAGTLGKEVWLVLPEAADWRWGHVGDMTPWYPTMRLVRKRSNESTTDLVNRLVQDLQKRFAYTSSREGVWLHSQHASTGVPGR